MKVLWVGDAVCSSGFARCTHAACDALHATGHEVHVLGINYFGDPHKYSYSIYPCRQPLDYGLDGFGVHRLPHFIARLRPDVVVLLNDPWNIKGYFDVLRRQLPDGFKLPPIVGWLAVDANNVHGYEVNDLAHVVTWTGFAGRELVKGGYIGDWSVVPLGVDHEIFHPIADARRVAIDSGLFPPSMDDSKFIVGVIGRNQPRKRLDLTLAYFADWVIRFSVDNAMLCLHIAPTGDTGVDLDSLIKYYGLTGRVLSSKPSIGVGITNEHLALLYSTFDVFLNTSQGEGWGLPVLESMACGVPCVVPDWSGLGDWTQDAAFKVECSSTAANAPIDAFAYTIGGIMDRQRCAWALNTLYRFPGVREGYRQRGLSLASGLSWHKSGQGIVDVIEDVVANMVVERKAVVNV